MARFNYHVKGRLHFSTPMRRTRCKAAGCAAVTKYPPFCAKHAAELLGVRVAPSRLRGAGLGLFTTRALAKGAMIAPLFGQVVTGEELFRRYGAHTAPYAVQTARVLYDGAGLRYVGHMSNTVLDAAGHSVAAACNADIAEDKRGRPWIHAKKPIGARQEVLTYYGTEYTVEKATSHHSTD